jgi:hypothetical protein
MAALAQVGDRSGSPRPAFVLRRRRRGQDDDSGRRGDSAYPASRSDPVEDRHVQVHEHDVGLKVSSQLDRLPAVPRAAGDLDALVELQRERQRFHEEGVIVGDHDPELGLRRQVRLRLHGV